MKQSQKPGPRVVSPQITCLLSLFFIGALAGCTGPQGQRELPAAPSEAVRRAIQKIAIVCDEDPRLEMKAAKTPGAAAAQGALGGFFAGAAAPGGSGGGDFAGAAQVLVWAVTIPVGTVVGAVSGWGEGVPKEEIDKAQGALRVAAQETAISSVLRERLIAEGVRKTQYAFSEGEEAQEGSQQRSAGKFDTVLELRLLNLGLIGPADANPDLAVFVKARLRLVRVADGAELYTYTWVQSSGCHKFTDWGADDAKLFREQLKQIADAMAESIIEELFLVHHVEK